MAAIKLKLRDRGRLALLWEELREAERVYTFADNRRDLSREMAHEENRVEVDSALRTGVDIVGKGGFAQENVQSVESAFDRANERWENAQLNLRTGYVAVLGDEAGPLIDQLLTTIEGCYEPGERHFRELISGKKGDQAMADVRTAMELINELVEGDPVMVGVVPAPCG